MSGPQAAHARIVARRGAVFRGLWWTQSATRYLLSPAKAPKVLKMTTPAGMGKRRVKDPTRVKAVAGGRALTRKNEAAF